jgi:hypothetical protein
MGVLLKLGAIVTSLDAETLVLSTKKWTAEVKQTVTLSG